MRVILYLWVVVTRLNSLQDLLMNVSPNTWLQLLVILSNYLQIYITHRLVCDNYFKKNCLFCQNLNKVFIKNFSLLWIYTTSQELIEFLLSKFLTRSHQEFFQFFRTKKSFGICISIYDER